MKKKIHLIIGKTDKFINPNCRKPEVIEYNPPMSTIKNKPGRKKGVLSKRYILAYRLNDHNKPFPRKPILREEQFKSNELIEVISYGMRAAYPFFIYDNRFKQVILLSY